MKLFQDNEAINNLIIIEGIIGCGKTTLGRLLQSRIPNCIFIEEQIDFDLLRQFLNDMKRYAYAFELSAIFRRYEGYLRAISLCNQGYTVIMERSLLGDIAFVQTQYELGNLTEEDFQMLLYIFEKYGQNIPSPKKILYLDVDINVAMERIQKRDRQGEDSYQKNYQQVLVKHYQNVIRKQSRVMHLDWSQNFEDLNSIPTDDLQKQLFN